MNFAREDLACYSYDAAAVGPLPDVVAFPHTAVQVMQLVRYANRAGIPVVPRGAGTGCCGGALSAHGGILLSFENMNQVLSIDTELGVGMAQPGVTTEKFQMAAERKGLFYPPDPSSARICTLGGNVGHGAGGLRGLRYGTTKDYLVGLEAVMADGHLLRTGFFSSSESYDTTGLLVGSEGTLAIVTKMALRLLPMPEDATTALFIFPHAQQIVRAAQRVLGLGMLPVALEYMDQKALECIRAHGAVNLPAQNGYVLLVEFCGRRRQVEEEASQMSQLAKEEGAVVYDRAIHPEERDKMWALRRALSPSMAHAAEIKISQDVCVPTGAIGSLLEHVDAIARRRNLLIISFGHLGDGNIHVNIMTSGRPAEKRRAQAAVEDLLRVVLSLKGTLSGEHGIGRTKASYLAWELSAQTLVAHRKVKAAFDPRGFLNPGNIFSSS
jgi:glycolate oxidase